MKLSLPRSLSLLALLVLFVSGQSGNAQIVAGLMDDGRVITADPTNFAPSRTTIATFNNSGGSFVDVTYGNGLIYGLRADGAVFSTDLAGSISTVSTTGWSSAITHIDYANGTLFGMAPGATTTVLDTGGSTRISVGGFTAGDFGVRGDGSITLLTSATNTWSFTFVDGYSGGTGGGTFTNFVSGQAPIAIDVNDDLASVLSLNSSTTGVEWRYQDGLGSSVVFGKNNITNATSLALTDDNSSIFYLAPTNGNVFTSVVASDPTITNLGQFAAGTGVGIVVVPEPSSGFLLMSAVTAFATLRRRRKL